MTDEEIGEGVLGKAIFRQFKPLLTLPASSDRKSSEVSDVQENVRIDRGHCVARCYRVSHMFAMWLIDIGILQFYDADGEMLQTINLFAEMQPHRAAA